MISYDALAKDCMLIERIKQGDHSARETLYDSYYRLLYAFAGRFSTDKERREELVHAGYIGLYKAAQRFETHREVRFVTYAVPWILGEMRQTMRTNIQQIEVVSFDHPLGDSSQPLNELLCSCDIIDVTAMDVRIALSKLSQEEQLLICLRYFRDKTQKETALLLKKSQAQISRIERRAIERLQISLRE